MPLVELTVNGRAVRVDVPTHWTLIQLLRDGLGYDEREDETTS